MRWLIILIAIPMVALAGNNDELVISVGFLILTLAITAYRVRRYFDNMSNEVESALSLKQQLAGIVTAGGLTLTATNVISLVGMCLTAAGLVFIYLNWRQTKRRDKVAEKRLELEERKLKFEMEKARKTPKRK